MARRLREEEQQFEDVSSYSSSKEYKKRRKNRRGRTVLKGIAAVFCVLLIALGSGMVYVATMVIDDLTISTITKDPETLGFASSVPVMDDSIRNIAVFGVDSRQGTFQGNSDVIMILTVDNKHRKLKMTSILRDSQVSIEGDSYANGYIDWYTKINSAYDLGGPELAIRTLNRNFSLRIEDYVTINITNMATIVDAFGGVTIEITEQEAQEINSNLWAINEETKAQIAEDEAAGISDKGNYVNIKHEDFFQEIAGGTYLLNGNQAVAYGRIRKIDSDDERAVRQQTVFKALVSKVKDISFSQYPSLIDQMMPLCDTNLDLGTVIGLAPILTSDFTIESTNVPDHIHEVTAEEGTDYVFDLMAAAERISSFIYEEDSPYWDKYGDTAFENRKEESDVY